MKPNYLLFLVLATGLVKPEEAMSQKISQKELGGLVEKAKKKFDVPALSVVLLNSEKITMHELQGVRIVNTDSQVTPDDYFHIGSCSKSVLALIAGKLVEENKINWDTKFLDLYPDLKAGAREDYHSITLEDLFLCKAGIKPFTSGKEKFPDLDPNCENKKMEFIKWLLKQPPISQKTADNKFQHVYSNAGYTMIAAMLENVSEKTWEDLIVQTLTTDLGWGVLFGWPNQYNTSQPWGHSNFIYDLSTGIDTKLKNGLRAYPPEDPYKLTELIAPAGDLSMNPLDFAKYTQLHLQGLTGKNNYISSSTYQTIHFGHQGFSIGVGNGKLEGKIISGFDGSAGTFYCRGIIIPSDDMAFTIMINSGSEKAVEWMTKKIIKKYYNWWWKVWV